MSQSFCFGASNNNRNNNAGNTNQASLSMVAWGSSSSNTQQNQQAQNNSANPNANNANTNSIGFAFPADGGNNANNNSNNASNANPMNSANMNAQQQGGHGGHGHGVNPLQLMEHLQSQYDPRQAQCRFESVLYNKIPANMSAAAFDKPPLIRTAVWEQGLANNPSPNKLVPVAVRGYDEMGQRSNLCLAGHCSAIKRFEELSEKVSALKHRIDVKAKQTITDLKQTQIFLSQRLLCVLRGFVCQMTSAESGSTQIENNNPNLSTLSLSLRSVGGMGGMPLGPNEIKLKKVLEQMARESNQLMQLYGHVNRVASRMDTDRKGFVVQSDAEHLSAETMQQMFSFLKQQQQFVHLLAKTVQTDIKHLDVIRHGMQIQTKSEAGHFGGGARNRNASAIF